MHVVLSGYYGFDNVGDEAILFSIISALRKLQKDIQITVLSNNPESTQQTYGVGAVNRWKMKEVSAALKGADGLISGGGSLLQDQTGMKSIPYYSGIMQIAKMHKKPVFVYAQGMGPINKGISKLIVRKTLNKVDQITVRDEESKKLLENIGIKKSIGIVPDPVTGLDGSSFHSSWLESAGLDNYIAISVRDWPTTVDYRQKIVDSLDQLAGNGETIIFVPMHGEHDARTSREFAELMKEKSLVAPADLSIEEKIAIIGQSKLLIGMRLHSLIFSSIFYTPFIAISYDPKIDAFAKIAGQPIIGHVEQDNWDGHQLYAQAKDILENRASLEASMKATIQPIQSQALDTAKMALDVFGK
ncbi:polysaccharide pyruvyl transferase CsaB [Ureibacillus aquaedulcis]|uniref:Polysaccharide pyruvyl transferase CsaB n=1 Tax=Ureibacillus aquaedulcis TaxID=3058421 RepID=A0ABT8GL91_9BACL|nr:polysaccharide pyruvyl transferase CsaB [Ureibacillus sp. BA0131]MDN4492139.1 polysaccharide pyruvyl transferase CsaB [Ureibacillus sp. BA0131]